MRPGIPQPSTNVASASMFVGQRRLDLGIDDKAFEADAVAQPLQIDVQAAHPFERPEARFASYCCVSL